MEKFRDALKEMSFKELRNIEHDMKSGGDKIKRILWDEMQSRDNSLKFCATCFTSITHLRKRYTLIIHKDGFARQVSFCAADCLKYFIEHCNYINSVMEVKDVRKTQTGKI